MSTVSTNSTDWYNFYLDLWIQGTVTVAQLQKAVAKGRITQAEYEAIIATTQNNS